LFKVKLITLVITLINDIEFLLSKVHVLNFAFELNLLILVVIVEDSPIVLGVMSIDQNGFFACDWSSFLSF